jgi:tRNA uracil 4-sulfurtransferase
VPRQLYLLRFSGEISTKAPGTRLRFTRRLARNLRAALVAAGIEHRQERRWSRIYVETADPRAAEVFAEVFGIHSFSPVECRPWRGMDDLVAAGVELFAAAVAGKTFAVRVRRCGDRAKIPLRSTDLERELGRALLPHARGVDLDHPEATVRVEVRPEQAFYFTARVPGPGGLPLGVEGRALALLSGGFDSAVAAWMMLRRGLALDYLFFHLGGGAIESEVVGVLRVLAERWSHGARPRLHVVDFRPLVAELGEGVRPRYRQVVLKRQMLRAAEEVARQVRAVALVTGDAIGQVSSQTPQNLAVISRPIVLPVFRPLLGFHKEEILERARRIGTYELSAAVPEHCALVPRHPATRAPLAAVEAEVAALDPGYLERAVGSRRVVAVRGLEAAALAPAAVAIDEVPAGATVLDLRPRHAFDAWHHPGALRLDFFAALACQASFDPAQTYVVYCEHGLKSAHLAEVLRQRGCRAYYLQGGAGDRRRRTAAEGALVRQLLAPALLGE